MTFLIDSGVIVKTYPKTYFQPTFRLNLPLKINLAQNSLPDDMPKNREVKFNYLFTDDGDTYYIEENTKIRNFFSWASIPKTNLLVNVNVYDETLMILNKYKKPIYDYCVNQRNKEDILQEVFKQIAKELNLAVTDDQFFI